MAKKIYEQKGAKLEIVVTCRRCKEDCSLDMTYDQYKRLDMFQKGTGYAHTILSDLPEDVREIFISGFCSDCWNEIFENEEEVEND